MIDDQTRLSIAIPTYNFGRFIGETLASIVPQIEPGVEIVILDGGSTDNTATVVAQWQARCPAIRYVQQAKRGGIDRDMARVVELSRGEYVWLFSADDTMRAGAIVVLLEAVRSGDDMLLCAHGTADIAMTILAERYPVFDDPEPFGADLGDAAQRRTYFARAATTEAFFSFIGGLIVRRTSWDRGTLDPVDIGGCWAHAARLLRLAPGGLRVRWLGRVLLDRRGDNDSFRDSGIVPRFALAIDGYPDMAARIFGADSVEVFHVRRVIRREFTPIMLLAAKQRCVAEGNRASLRDLDRLATKLWSDGDTRARLELALYRWFPLSLWLSARWVFRAAVRIGLVR